MLSFIHGSGFFFRCFSGPTGWRSSGRRMQGKECVPIHGWPASSTKYFFFAPKGCHILLGPTVNTQRSPLGGRGFESFSEDPHLNGTIAAAYINGLQSKGGNDRSGTDGSLILLDELLSKTASFNLGIVIAYSESLVNNVAGSHAPIGMISKNRTPKSWSINLDSARICW